MTEETQLQAWPVQTPVIAGLIRQIDTGQLPHAMLFVGTDQQTATVTRHLAKLLLCQQQPAPCGVCAACLQFEADNHPDYHVIEPANSGAVKTADIEDIQARLKLRSHHGGRVVYVISHIDQATPVAANRLLKGLEEPNAPIIALLTANTLSRVLPTIRSRAFVYQLGDSEPSVAVLLEPVIQWMEAWLVKREFSLTLAKQLSELAASATLADVLDTLLGTAQQLVNQRIGRTDTEPGDERIKALAQQLEPAGWAYTIERLLDAKLRLQAHVGTQSNVEQLCIRLREVYERYVSSGGGSI